MADETPRETYVALRDAYNAAIDELNDLGDELDKLKADKDTLPETIEDATAEFNAKFVDVEERKC